MTNSWFEQENWKDILIRYQQEEIKELKARLLASTKPHSEVSKLKIFIEVFNALSGQERKEVNEQSLIDELIRTTQFTYEEAMVYIKKAMQNGQIYELKDGLLARP